jgi:hypothetical protein
MHAMRMSFQQPTHLAIVRRSAIGAPRTYRVRRSSAGVEPARNAAYRRLAAAVLGLDVPTIAAELRSARVLASRLALAA